MVKPNLNTIKVLKSFILMQVTTSICPRVYKIDRLSTLPSKPKAPAMMVISPGYYDHFRGLGLFLEVRSYKGTSVQS